MQPNKLLFLATSYYKEPLLPWIYQAELAGYTVESLFIDSPLEGLDRKFSDVTVVMEWLPLKDGFKETVLKHLESRLSVECLIFSSAHESLATHIAAWLQSPERLIGFSPLGCYRQSKMVTLALPHQGSETLKSQAEAFWQSLHLQPNWIQDTPGMVLPRVYAMLANEAAFALQEQVASPADIDTAMRLGTNYPLGPLAWADLVGTDVVLQILETLWQVYREERYRPCLLLQKMVLAGHFGKRAGQGFYPYPPSTENVCVTKRPEMKV
jgi:3-hydroxybutyryl-CoA dehydrogenase